MPGLEAPQQLRKLLIGTVRALAQVLQRRPQAAHGHPREPLGVFQPRVRRRSRGHVGQAQVDGKAGRQDILDGSVVQISGQAAPLVFRDLSRCGRRTAAGGRDPLDPLGLLGWGRWLQPE